MKHLFICLGLILSSAFLYAEDIIITRTSEKIAVTIEEVGVDYVKYHTVANPNGPLFRLEASEIATIIYGNGEVQTFEQKSTQDPVQTQGPVQTQVPVQTQTSAPNMQGYQPYNSYAQPYSMMNYKAMQKMREDSIKAVKKEEREEKKLAFKAKMDAIPSYHFLLANYAYTSNNSHNVGLTYGWCHAVGVYVNMMLGVSGFNYGVKEHTDVYFKGRGAYYADYQMTNEHTHQRISITPGIMVRLGCPLYWNAGLGYAYNSLTYKNTTGKWISVGSFGTPHRDYINFQTGLMANIKGFSLMLDYSLLFPTYSDEKYTLHEIMLGIGFTLDGKKGGKK